MLYSRTKSRRIEKFQSGRVLDVTLEGRVPATPDPHSLAGGADLFISVKAVEWVLENSESTGNARNVLTVLASYYNNNGTSWPSFDTIVRLSNTSRPTVVKAISELEALGEVEVIRQEGTSNIYTFPKFVPVNTSKENTPDQSSFTPKPVNPSLPKKEAIKKEQKEEELKTEIAPPSEPLPLNREVRVAFPKPVKKEKVRKGFGNTTRPVYEPKAPPRKAPAEWQWFASLYHRSTEKIPVSCPKYWDALEAMLKEINQTEAERLFSLWLDQVDRLTAWTGLNFLEGEWKLVQSAEQEGGSSAMPTLKGWDE